MLFLHSKQPTDPKKISVINYSFQKYVKNNEIVCFIFLCIRKGVDTKKFFFSYHQIEQKILYLTDFVLLQLDVHTKTSANSKLCTLKISLIK